jgi:hypothetical protein
MWADFAFHFNGILQNLEEAQWTLNNCDSEEAYRLHLQKRLQSDAKCQDSVTKEHHRKMEAVRQWLAIGRPPELDHQYYQQIRNDYPSTGYWILEHQHIKQWMTADVADKSVMWMTGVPGAGMLHHYIIDRPDYEQVRQYLHLLS